jgi:hypothetical protein
MAKKSTGKKLPNRGQPANRERSAKKPSKAGSARVKAKKKSKAAVRRTATPYEQAQKLIEKAMALRNPERQISLANDALELCPDCADAFTLLSQFIADHRHALLILEQGVKAAERVIGAAEFERLAGRFWSTEKTQAFMRARLTQADCQWEMGLRAAAVDNLQQLMKLNPNDDQGIRYLLAAHLLELDLNDEFDRLMELHGDESTFMQFSKLLREFRRGADEVMRQKLLARAMKKNSFVVPFLLESEPLPEERPDLYMPGSPAEAVLYVIDLGLAWKETPGALSWLRGAIVTEPRKGARSAASPKPDIQKVFAGESAGPPALVEIETFRSSRGARFFSLASEFFHLKPWQCAPSDSVLQVDCAQLAEFGSRKWFVVLSGPQQRFTGLLMCTEYCDVKGFLGLCCSQDENTHSGTVIEFQFVPESESAAGDIRAAKEHGWQLAGPEQFPKVIAMDGDDLDCRPIKPWELDLLESILTAVPEFVRKHSFAESLPGDDPVKISTAKLKFEMSWLEPEFGSCGSACGGCEDDHDHD